MTEVIVVALCPDMKTLLCHTYIQYKPDVRSPKGKNVPKYAHIILKQLSLME